MIICKNWAIVLLLLLIIYLDEAGAYRKRTGRKSKCAKPKEVQHAVLREKYANKEKFKEGDKVEYDCELGYTIEGTTRERWCRNTIWTEVRFTCNQITCSWVPHPDNGRHLDTTYAVGDVMKFECNTGYKLKGRDKILCRIDGQWSPPQGPTCDPILCPTLPEIQHGSIFQDTSDGLANNYESVAEYTCDRHYYLNGNTQLKTVKRTCQSDGKWSGKEPICEVPKCNLIEDFYGGSVEYFGKRDLYSQAFYSCDENYSMIPSNVQHSTCENNLRWEPPPPKCFKKVDRDVPNNGTLRGRKRGKVLHNESYRICCNKGFEVERDGIVPVYKDSCTNTRNNNGTLEPRVECVEGRCDPNDLDKAYAEYENKTKVELSTKIQSRTNINIFCQHGFAFYDENGQGTETSQKRQCIMGTIVDAPKCQEAKCSLVGYPTNPDTYYYNHVLRATIQAKVDYINSRHQIEVRCNNTKQYELYAKDSKKYIRRFMARCEKGKFKKAKNQFPVCFERRCVFEPSKVQGACFVIDDERNCERKQIKLRSRSSIHIQCEKGYTLFVSGKEVKDRGEITCVKGSYPDFNCTANDCTAPEVNNTESLSEIVFKHEEKVTYKCKEGYWFSKSKLEKQEVLSFESKCHLGNWTTHIPESCEPVACYLKVLAGNEYSIYGTENVIVNDSFQDNGTSIGVRCKDGFDLYDDADTLIKNTTFVPEVTCHVGKWSNIHWCKKRCNIPTRLNIQFSKDGENLTINDTIKHMESVNIICTGEHRISSSIIKCVNGIFDPYGDCTSDNDSKSHISTSTLSTASTNNINTQQQNENEAPDDNLTEMEDYSDGIEDHSNSSEGCKLSDDERYTYWNTNGDEIKPGDNIVAGDILTVKCRFIDMYTFMTYDYDYYNDTDTTADNIPNSDDITIFCKNDHSMTKITKECYDATKDKSCLQIDNGNVIISNSYYVVSCDKGFSLDIFEPEEKRSNCIDGKLKSVIGGQEPECIPDRCKVPYDYDTLLSISDRSHVSLSGGSVVAVGDFVYFNCSKTGNDMHEPVNRRFKCINGQWIEDERDKSWKFGNNGTFPKCRKTMCEPECENGGVCVRDGECKCKHFTSGKHCENVLCDDKCKSNNGECVGPGKCRCPEGKFGTNCEHSSCRLPEIENMAKLNTPRTYYDIGETVRGFTCSPGYFLSSDKGMTCQNNGTWSDVITCVKGIRYLISAKTGTRPGAGTNANVYITLSGSGGSTRIIDFKGGFESGDVDEIRELAKDIRPIHKVQIGHDGGSWHDILLSDWDLEYVSIYVENMEEFYVFRNNRKQWVEKDNVLTLYREGNKACINSFDNGHLWYLDWEEQQHIPIGNMSLRTCKQTCVNWKDEATHEKCLSVYYDHLHTACYGFTFSDRFDPMVDRDWRGKVYLRTCKNNNTV
ncbi:sushi, von Willebrand factor type A, EGF and pentraxin domain-containing protein 1-like isoform X2 [Ruditapes philippinarum]|uniref:sushi, von Willebrand factor type A, EGF and pentraxin domain-containing protein 1-like isoform X2 n=1 Tax=Ruditapes philippinarum TaxID=129788 RepID=UPI00295AAC17|nr:sushi, von Willebrand factor type A, EGF and pentraxin domain-containing protein 1-like isoform X2 [Ruditapes philippinarum]